MKNAFVVPDRTAMLVVADIYQTIHSRISAGEDYEDAFAFIESVEIDRVGRELARHKINMVIHTDQKIVVDEGDDEDAIVLTVVRIGEFLRKLKTIHQRYTITARLPGRVPVTIEVPRDTARPKARKSYDYSAADRTIGLSIINAPINFDEVAHNIARAAADDIVKEFQDSMEGFDADSIASIVHKHIVAHMSEQSE